MALARRALKRERKMDVAKSHANLSRSDGSPNVTKPSYDSMTSNDAVAAGAASIADIERLMAELQAARDYLQGEGERVRQINAHYACLAQTASASARVIADSIGKWNIPSGNQLLPAAMGPSASPDGEIFPATVEMQPALEMMEKQLTQMIAPSKPR